MNRACLLVIAGVLAGCAHATDTMTTQMAPDSVVVDNPGKVTVAGVTPAAALGAINTQQVTVRPAVPNGGERTADRPATDAAAGDAPTTDANGAIAVEGAQPAAVLGAIDPKKLVDKTSEKPN